MAPGPILVTGGSGQVGCALVRLAAERGIAVEAPGRERLDLADAAALTTAVTARPWRAVINCAAYTAVDRAESEPDLARAINAAAPAVLAAATARAGIPLLHVSTDYVFDGTKPEPYGENDPTAPLGVYGVTKLAGEEAIRAAHPNHAIVRTAWVLSAGGGNFLDTMLRLAATREQVSVVDDQRGCPTNAGDVAAALLAVAERLGARSGTWHFVNRGNATWHALA
ncbi:MAG: dTDP-4-dehydrorhamnose reductase, partial [Novosphingobium sp.]